LFSLLSSKKVDIEISGFIELGDLPGGHPFGYGAAYDFK
jgi:hypothetical protein